MANSKKRTKGAKGATVATVAPAAPAAKVQTLGLVAGAVPNFRQGSARQAYYNAMHAMAGQPVAAVAAAIAANPPSQPRKGKLAGQTEPFAGWLGWFVRNGYFTVNS
jgi:hypothetical protein